MKTLVIGDIHGQFEIVTKVLSYGLPTIFVGDYLDSYDRSVEDQILALDLVLDAVENKKATALLGNHELSYLDPKMRCSGYRMETQLEVDKRAAKMHSLLKPYAWREGFLISHAGVSLCLLQALDMSLYQYLGELNFSQIGESRGGRDCSGGLHWCDWNFDFVPVPGFKQIVGHTRGKEVREQNGNYCIDVLESGSPVVLAIETGEAEVWEL